MRTRTIRRGKHCCISVCRFVNFPTGSLESLKGSHVSFNGYGIDVNETIKFGTIEDYNISGNIKKVPTYNGSSRYIAA